MSTRSNIVFRNDDGTYTATYHHWDGYPSGLGKTLWTLYHGHFQCDLATMRKVLIDDHPGGWSTINDKDFSLEPGFWEMGSMVPAKDPIYPNQLVYPDDRPLCYCHGDRSESGMVFSFTSSEDYKSQPWEEWAYFLFPQGLGISDVDYDTGLGEITVTLWDAPEPNWDALS